MNETCDEIRSLPESFRLFISPDAIKTHSFRGMKINLVSVFAHAEVQIFLRVDLSTLKKHECAAEIQRSLALKLIAVGSTLEVIE